LAASKHELIILLAKGKLEGEVKRLSAIHDGDLRPHWLENALRQAGMLLHRGARDRNSMIDPAWNELGGTTRIKTGCENRKALFT
jgi:hypothetical protein